MILTFEETSLDQGRSLKQSQKLQSIEDLSAEQVRFVKLLSQRQRKLGISTNLGTQPRQRYPRGLVKLKIVKLRIVGMLAAPGLAPHVSQVQGASTTPSKMTESINESNPIIVKRAKPKNIAAQVDPHMTLFFPFIQNIQSYPNNNHNLFYKMSWLKRGAYLFIMTGLTSSAIGACYWQTKRYMQARQRWDTIKRQLNLQNPDRLEELAQGQIYPFKYVAVKGNLEPGFERVQRTRNGRMGYLVVRALTFTDQNQQKQQIAALEGWCDDQFVFQAKDPSLKRQIRGILREKQKKDYVHSNFKKQDLQRFKMTTYIDLETILPKFNIKPTTLSSNYYLQILKPLQDNQGSTFPYQYSVDNFELPYLTPDKHLSYATFWGCTTLVGLFGIFRALKLR